MNYEILIENTGLVSCVYDATAGVGRVPDERKIFQDLLGSQKVDYYICPKCVYVITTDKYDIMFKDLKLLRRLKNKVFFKSPDGELIPVTKQNLTIRCYLKTPECPEAWVQVYIPRKHRKK